MIFRHEATDGRGRIDADLNRTEKKIPTDMRSYIDSYHVL
jgi:hypothetical protein